MTPSALSAVPLLNADLRGEHVAIVQYLTHAWQLGEPWASRWESIARDEMRHFRWLAHAIVGLGGIPDLTPPPPPASDGDLVRQDLAAEEAAIAQYRAH